MGWERWRRVPEPGACDFCLMLATRGAVYASQETAGRDNDYHAHCHCDQESEGNFDARTDIKVDPGDAERIVGFRHERSGYEYTYDMSRFRNVGVSDVPALEDVAAKVDVPPSAGGQGGGSAGGPPRGFTHGGPSGPVGPDRRPSAEDLFREGVVGEGHEHFSDAESTVAVWVQSQTGSEIRSVLERDVAFPDVSGLRTPDAVGRGGLLGDRWVTVELKSAKGIPSLARQVRNGKNLQSSRIVVQVPSNIDRELVEREWRRLVTAYLGKPDGLDLLAIHAVDESGRTVWDVAKWGL